MKDCTTCEINIRAQNQPTNSQLQMMKSVQCEFCKEDDSGKPLIIKGGYQPKDTVFAKPEGIHYHLKRNCPILRNFKDDKYVSIKFDDVNARKLERCPVCAKFSSVVY